MFVCSSRKAVPAAWKLPSVLDADRGPIRGMVEGKRTRCALNEAMKMSGKKMICTTRWRHDDECQSGRRRFSISIKPPLWYGTTTNNHNGQSKRAQATTKYNTTEVRLEARTRTSHLKLLQPQSLTSWRAFTSAKATRVSPPFWQRHIIFLQKSLIPFNICANSPPLISGTMGQYTKANGFFWKVGDNNQAEVVDESTEKEVCFGKKMW